MDTKRCTHCHKLLRADTRVCSRCGHAALEKKHKTSEKEETRPSIPHASPHRVGHYSGLHPEDQPYQSTMIAVQHSPVEESEPIRLPLPRQKEPQHIVLPIVDIPTEKSTRYKEPLTPTERKPPLPRLPRLPRRPQPSRRLLVSNRAIPILLTLSVLFFLLASSILAFSYMQKNVLPSLEANPTLLRAGDTFTLTGRHFAVTTSVKFSYDSNNPIVDGAGRQLRALTDNQGGFSVQIPVLSRWGTGQHSIHATADAQATVASTLITVQQPPPSPPQLQLVTTYLDLGADRAGTTSSKQISLVNAGGGQISWQDSSDAVWLTASPGDNSYVFSGRSLVNVTVNRGNLTPRTYIGHITFSQKESSNFVKLTVTMKVNPAPAALTVSQSSLTFSATSTQPVPAQSIILQNSGGQSLDWRASVSTNDGASWLFLSQASGRIDPGLTQALGVTVQAQQLAVGSYQGTITLTGGAHASVTVSLSVLAPGNIVVSPSSLTFAALVGQQNSTGKTITLQNSGGQSLDWQATATTVNSSNWLSVTPASGSISAGGQVTVTVNVNATSLSAESYQGMLTFSSGSLTSIVPVSLTVTQPPAPIISIQNSSLNFTTTRGNNPLPQVFIITNTGNATLNWSATESGSGATFAPLSAYHGSLLPQQSIVLNVTPNVANYKPTQLSTTITINDSDAGTTVASQKVPITITIQSQPAISVSPTNNSLNMTTNTQAVTITNTGTAPLNWAADVQTDSTSTTQAGPWLSVDSSFGTLNPGQSQTIHLICDGSHLSHGMYQGRVIISDSDAGTVVVPQTAYVTFAV